LHRYVLLTVNKRFKTFHSRLLMLHHGPNHSHLVVLPRGGLGNRMLCVLSGLYYVEAGYYDSMTINWLYSDHCNIDISEFCEFNCDIDIVSDTVMLDPDPQFRFNNGFKYDSISASHRWNRPDHIIPQLTDWASTTSIIKWNLPTVDRQYDTGLHCRRSDWGHHQYNTDDKDHIIDLHNQLDELFYQWCVGQIKGSVYIASDSNKTAEYFSALLNANHLTKTEQRYDSKRTRGMIWEALVDLAHLSNCKTIIRDSYSTFAMLAQIIGNTKLVTWDRPILKMSGCGYITDSCSNYHINK